MGSDEFEIIPDHDLVDYAHDQIRVRVKLHDELFQQFFLHIHHPYQSSAM